MYGISTLTALVVEGEVSGILRRKRMEKKIKTSRLKDKYNIMVLACQEKGKKDFIINPPSSTPLTGGTTLMVMGNVETIKEVRAIA